MALTLPQLQALIRDAYDAKDQPRVEGIFMWFAWRKSVSCPARPSRQRQGAALAAEFADVLAWLATLANSPERRFGCGAFPKGVWGPVPGCGQSPCVCDQAEKP